MEEEKRGRCEKPEAHRALEDEAGEAEKIKSGAWMSATVSGACGQRRQSLRKQGMAS